MNIYDVSKLSGVSIATVSRVLNNSPLVKDSTRNKVLSAIEELGYSPNMLARGLSLGVTKTIGIICSDTSDLYTAKAISCFESLLRENNFDILLSCTPNKNDELNKSLNILISKGVQAVIFIGSKYISNNKKDNSAIINASKKVPIFLLNGILQGIDKDYTNIYSTYYDDELATYNLIKHFHSKGQRNFIYFYNSKSQSGQRKLSGIKKIKKELKANISAIFTENEDCLIEHLKDLFSKRNIPDTVICSSDFLAAYVLKFTYKYKNDLRVPENFLLIGYDNSIISRLSIPEISSIDSKVDELCNIIINNLIRVLSGENIKKATIVKPKFIERESTIIL